MTDYCHKVIWPNGQVVFWVGTAPLGRPMTDEEKRHLAEYQKQKVRSMANMQANHCIQCKARWH